MRTDGAGVTPHDRAGERIGGTTHLQVAPRPFEERQEDPARCVSRDARGECQPLSQRRECHGVVAHDHGRRMVERLVGRLDLERLHAEQPGEAPARGHRSRVTLEHGVGRLQSLGGIAVAREGLQRMERSEAGREPLERRERRAVTQPGAMQDHGRRDPCLPAAASATSSIASSGTATRMMVALSSASVHGSSEQLMPGGRSDLRRVQTSTGTDARVSARARARPARPAPMMATVGRVPSGEVIGSARDGPCHRRGAGQRQELLR